MDVVLYDPLFWPQGWKSAEWGESDTIRWLWFLKLFCFILLITHDTNWVEAHVFASKEY